MSAPDRPLRVRFGVFELDDACGELRKDGVAIRLSPQPFQVLRVLVACAGQLVTREDLIHHVWGTQTFVDFDRGLNFCIAQIRAALGDDAAKPIYIQTVPRRGYRFVAPVTRLDEHHDQQQQHQQQQQQQRQEQQQEQPPPAPERRRAIGVLQVCAALLVLLAFVAIRAVLERPGQTSSSIALAVLPFEDLTTAPVPGDRLADEVTDELIGTLGRVAPDRLTVIARTSVMKYRGTKTDVQAIAAALHVRYLVEGSVRRDDDRLRLDVRLVDGRSRRVIWSRTWTPSQRSREADSHAAFASHVASALAMRVGLEPARVAAPPAVAEAARDHQINARYLRLKGDPDSLARSVDELREAIRIDPRFALAHASLADALLAQALTGARATRAIADEARRAAAEAIALDPESPDAQGASGLVHLWLDWDPARAEAAFRRTLRANPSLAAVHHDLAWALMAQSRADEAVDEIWRAHQLDPLSMRSSLDIGWIYLRARRYDEAIAHCQRTLRVEPANAGAQGCLEHAFRKTGRLADAWSLAQRWDPAAPRIREAHARAPDPATPREASSSETSPSGGARASERPQPSTPDDARAGLQRVAEQRLRRAQEAAARGYVSPYQLATLHAALGQADEAFAWLERAFAERDGILVLLPIDPEWDAVRDDPRLTRLVSRVRDARGTAATAIATALPSIRSNTR